jgi:RHS repeat-associated protein
MDYDEFGNVTNFSGQQIVPMGFAGGLYDQQTGFVRFGARDYDAIIGRWVVKDPILFASHSTNHYLYVSNNPVNSVDASGTMEARELCQNMAAAAFTFSMTTISLCDDILEIMESKGADPVA